MPSPSLAPAADLRPANTASLTRARSMTMADLSIRPASECGGEYNVARGLRRAFGLRGAIVTALADNEIGRLVEDFILTGGLDTSFIRWVPYDGIGRGARNGLNFTERGFGVRGAVGVSDRP